MNEDTRPTHLDLFSGIGGFSIAFEAAGFRTIGFAEIDPAASLVLRNRWPHIPNFGDIRNAERTADVVTAGFPCQPYSEAGQRRGAADDRHLWPTLCEFLRCANPAWFLGENVTHIDGLALDAVLDDLEAIGYETAPPLEIPAGAAGAHQRRYRTWILAYAAGKRRLQTHKAPGLAGQTCEEPALKVGWGGVFRSFRISGDAFWIAPDRCFDGVAYGLHSEIHRVRLLGNSIAPAVAEIIAKAIYQQLRP